MQSKYRTIGEPCDDDIMCADDPGQRAQLPRAPWCAAAMLGAALAGCAAMPENIAPPPLPSAVRVPEGHRHSMTLKSVGTLNYECRARAGMSGAYAWVLEAPDAALLHWSGVSVGRYYAGPTLQYRDGSRVTLKLVGSSPDEPGKLPIHLYQAQTRSTNGRLSTVTYVQRLNAVTAEPSQPCAETRIGRNYKAKFAADFLFYTNN